MADIKKAPEKNPGYTPEPVPFPVYEAALAHEGEHNRHLFWALVIAIALLFASNMAWLRAWTSYDYVSDTITVESTATGHANYIGTNGSIYNGNENPSEETSENP